MKIFVYLPEWETKANLPKAWSDDWCFMGDGWGMTYQLYFALREHGFDVELSSALPQSPGVILSHAINLLNCPQPRADQYFICLQLDWPRDLWCHAHLVANRYQLRVKALSLMELCFCPGPRYWLRHMPQLGLRPRDLSSGDRFDTVGYFGLEKNLTPFMRSDQWARQLMDIGLKWHVAADPSQWADYSACDAVIALREEDQLIRTKPAQKLYNAWIAGVVPLLGPETGFREEGNVGVDFIEIRNSQDALEKLKQLKSKPSLRNCLLEAGRKRTPMLDPATISAEWAETFRGSIFPEAKRWLALPKSRREAFLKIRHLRKNLRNFRHKVAQ